MNETLDRVRALTEVRNNLSAALEQVRQNVRAAQDAIEEVEAELLAVVPPTLEPPDEIAWLVEGRSNGQPVWWTGEWWPRFAPVVNGPLHSSHAIARSTDDMEPVFSPEHLKAIRFSRKEDAERAIGLLPVFYRVAVKAIEHMWVAAPRVVGSSPPKGERK